MPNLEQQMHQEQLAATILAGLISGTDGPPIGEDQWKTAVNDAVTAAACIMEVVRS